MKPRAREDGAARRFLCRAVVEPAVEFDLDAEAAHKIARVLRLGPGDTIRVLDEAGVEHRAEILSCGRDSCRLRQLEVLQRHAPPLPLRVAMPLVKGERMDWAVGKIAETGVADLLLIDAERAVAEDASGEKIARWRRISEAACLQSMGGRPMSISDRTLSIDSILAAAGTKWHLEPGGSRAADLISSRPETPLTILVGPEGGWSDAEREKLGEKSTAVAWGKRILRTETAGVAAALLGSLFLSIDS